VSQPIVFGAAYSVYVRAVRLTLSEKRVSYRLQEVDIFAPGGPPADYLARQPFGRIPAFEHDGFALYETAAITSSTATLTGRWSGTSMSSGSMRRGKAAPPTKPRSPLPCPVPVYAWMS
jgi:hypothetical protein